MTYPDYAYMHRAIRDVNRVSHARVFAIGVAGGLLILAAESLFRALAWPTPNLEALFASLFGGDLNLAAPAFGRVLFLALSGLCAFAYSFIFRSAHRSGLGIGIYLSFFHWLMAGFLAGLLAPGFYWTRAGFAAAVLFLILHVLYGACVGALFDWAAQRKERPAPISPAAAN